MTHGYPLPRFFLLLPTGVSFHTWPQLYKKPATQDPTSSLPPKIKP